MSHRTGVSETVTDMTYGELEPGPRLRAYLRSIHHGPYQR